MTIDCQRPARFVALLALGLCLAGGAASPLRAQSPPAPTVRPQIGLALGGGSARGLAHIGVLKWFDEHRIPVDVVGGTSMGGLVGGAFATGMSWREILSMVDSADWATILAPDTSFAFKTFRRKEDARSYPSQLGLGLKGGFRLPSGLSPGEQVELLFDRIAAPYGHSVVFNDLPTPFRCVAADLHTSTAVVFDSGWLARALRATMAIPGMFSPVRIGNQVLVDGGVLNNVPADVVRNTGLATYVVAVDVGADLTYEKRSDSLFGVLGETLDVMMRNSVRHSLESADLVLTPDLQKLTGIEFGHSAEFTRLGYAAAQARATDLMRYAVSESEYAAWKAARQAKRKTALPTPVSITIEGVSAREGREIHRRLAAHIGRPFNPGLLDRDLTLLTGNGRYETATYRFDTANGRTALVVTIKPKAYGPPFLALNLDLQNSQSSNVAATIRGRVTLFDVVGSGSEGRVDFSLGNTLHAGAEVYRPIGRTGVFLSGIAFADRHDEPLFVDDTYTAEYRTRRSSVGADVGYSTERRFELRFGYRLEDLLAGSRIGIGSLPAVDGQQRFVSLRTVFDSQDGPTIPRHGLYATGEIRRFFSVASVTTPTGAVQVEPDNLLRAEADASWFHATGDHGRLFLRGAAGTAFGDHTVVNAFTLGGPFDLGAFYTNELRGSQYVLVNLGYFHELAKLAEGAIGRLYLGSWIDTGTTFERWNQASVHTNLSAAFILESPLGPVFVGGSAGGNRRYRIYIGLGPILKR